MSEVDGGEDDAEPIRRIGRGISRRRSRSRLCSAARPAGLARRGHPVVLNFWASWCVPCVEEAPELAELARRYRGRVILLGIDIQDFVSDARKFMDDVDASYVSVRDGTSKTSSSYGLTGLPETFYLDRNGRAMSHSIGVVSNEDLEVGIPAALGDAS